MGCFSSTKAMSCPAVMLFNGSDLGYYNILPVSFWIIGGIEEPKMPLSLFPGTPEILD